MTSPPRALIFDMDGVLIDSEPLWHEAEIAAMAEAGLVLARSAGIPAAAKSRRSTSGSASTS